MNEAGDVRVRNVLEEVATRGVPRGATAVLEAAARDAGSPDRARPSGARRVVVAAAAVSLVTALVALALVVIRSGADDGARVIDRPEPSSVSEFEGTGLVLERGARGPELCVGVVLSSLPPSCSGIPLANLSWTGLSGVDRMGGSTWGKFTVRGTFDGSTLTLTRPPVAARAPDPSPFGLPPMAALCQQPDTLDPSAGEAEWIDATRSGFAMPDARARWVTLPADSPSGTFLVNVLTFPGTATTVVARVREVWPGSLCVVEREPATPAQIAEIIDRLPSVIGQPVFGAHSGLGPGFGGDVTATIAVEDRAAQAAADEAFGAGVVHLEPGLTRAG